MGISIIGLIQDGPSNSLEDNVSASRVLRICFCTVLFCLAFSSFSLAYLDPGTGSYIFQLLLAGLLGALFLLKVYWKKVKSSIVNLFSGREHEMEGDEGAEQ